MSLLWTLYLQLPSYGYAQDMSVPPDYTALLKRRASLNQRQDSIQGRLANVRRLFSSDQAKKDEYGAEIIRLEKELFGLRDSLNTLTYLISEEEESGAVAGSDKPKAAGGSDSKNPYFASTDYIRNLLPPDEYRQLQQSQEAERKVYSQLSSIKYNYDMLAGAASLYSSAEKGPRADSLFSIISRFSGYNEPLVDSFGYSWMKVFEHKTYIYNYILDKENCRDILSDMEREMRELISEMDEVRDIYMYNTVAMYPLQKELILEYEIKIAEYAGLTRAADSLRGVYRTLDETFYFLPMVDTEERIFIDYSDYTVNNPPVYNNSNPVPDTEIHRKGIVYRVFVGAFSKTQPVSTFRNVSPVSREVKEDNLNYYYIGGYRTLEEAEDAAVRLKAHGFRNPRVVVWDDGVYSDSPASIQPGKSASKKASYRIEIRGASGALSPEITALIREKAPGKEISRVNDQQTGKQLFTIGFFDRQTSAETVANEIAVIDKVLDVSIAEIK